MTLKAYARTDALPTMKMALTFIAKWALAGLVFALALVWMRPDLRGAAHPSANIGEPHAAVAPRPASQIPPPIVAPGPLQSYADAVAKSAPAVVNIYTARVVAQRTRPPELDRFYGDRWPAVQERVEASLGSGVIIDSQGHVVTNNHVIANAPDNIRLQLADGRIADNVAVVGVDPETDLAVLRIKLDRLPVMTLGRSDTLRVGDVALAIGNPYGLSQTVTHGIVSATGRDMGFLNFESFIQTDAAINLGNSGGALVNAQGELIGINTAVLEQNARAEGISFAIPVDMVRGVVEQILKHGHVRRGHLGIGSQNVSPQRATELGLPQNVGIELTEIDADGPAARAGLRVGDVIVALNGATVHNWRDAMNRVAALTPGKLLHIQARRGKDTLNLRAKVDER